MDKLRLDAVSVPGGRDVVVDTLDDGSDLGVSGLVTSDGHTCERVSVSNPLPVQSQGQATAAKQDEAKAVLDDIKAATEAGATEAKQDAAQATLEAIQAAVENPALPDDAATETTLSAVVSAVGAVVSALADVATDTVLQAIRDRLPPALGTGGGLKASLVDLGGAATDVVAQAIRDRLPSSLVGGRLDTVIGAALPAGSNTIGKVDQGAGGASAWKVDGSATTQPVSDAGGSLTVDAPANAPVHVALASDTKANTMGSNTTGPWLVNDGPCIVYGADIVNGYGSTASLILFDSLTAPTAGMTISNASNGGRVVVQSAAGNPATRPYPGGRIIKNKLYAFVSSSTATAAFMHASIDSASVIIDLRPSS